MRDKTKNHTVNQKQAKNKTRIRHKNKWKAKEKFEININKQEPGTKKIIIITISLIVKPLRTNLVFDYTPCQGEYYQRRNPRYVSFLLRNRHRHFSVLGRCNLFLCVETAANCHPMGFGKNSKQNKSSSSVNRFWFITSIRSRPYTNTLMYENR